MTRCKRHRKLRQVAFPDRRTKGALILTAEDADFIEWQLEASK